MILDILAAKARGLGVRAGVSLLDPNFRVQGVQVVGSGSFLRGGSRFRNT